MMHLLIPGIIFAIILIVYPFIKSFSEFFEDPIRQNKVAVNPMSNEALEVLDYPEQGRINIPEKSTPSYPEILMMGIAPIAGIFLVYYFERDLVPFDLNHFPSLIAYIVFSYVCYWISRFGSSPSSGRMMVIVQHGLAIGILLYLFLFIHYISPLILLGGLVLPYVAFPLFAPLPALLYSWRQMERNNKKITERINNGNTDINLNNAYWNFRPQNILILLVLIFVIQGGLMVFGQGPFSPVAAFLGGEGFLLGENSWLFKGIFP